MKKLCYASLLLGLVLLLAGCGAAPAEPGPQESDVEAAKYHSYEILEGADGPVLYTVETPEAVAALDELIKDAGEARVERPLDEEGDVLYTYVYLQSPTIRTGQSAEEAAGEMAEILRLTVRADSDVVTLSILSGLEEAELLPDLDFEDLLTVHIQVSPETAEALRQPEQFAESEAS